MSRERPSYLAELRFDEVYVVAEPVLQSYIAYCKAIKEGIIVDNFVDQHLAHLEHYERAERGDFDSWLEYGTKLDWLIWYAVSRERCDIIEKYVPRTPHSRWNGILANLYKPRLYPVLHLVMPLPATVYAAVAYMDHDLHHEVAVHILGRGDSNTGKPITLEGIAMVAIQANKANALRNLEEIGLDLSDPMLLYEALRWRGRGQEVVILLRACCTRLDEVMPDGRTLRQMLA